MGDSSENLKILERKSNETEIPCNNFSKIWVYLAKASSEISENAVSFASGNFPKRKSVMSVEWRAPIE